MQIVGTVESLWRYPVKSMRGQQRPEVFIGFAGVYGDRIYAFQSSAAPKGFPYLTGREQEAMVLFRATFRHDQLMSMPPNLAAAEAISPGLTLVYANQANSMVDVETPSGEVLTIDDPKLIDLLSQRLRHNPILSLIRSDRSMTDCNPVSLISIQTVQQLGTESGRELDKRRFRANVYIDLASKAGFDEDAWVGRRLRLGDKVDLAVMKRDSRCKMITVDPDTAEVDPKVMRTVARGHEGKAGVYAVVLVEGVVKTGDTVTLLE